MSKCETCGDVEERIAKWIDHVGCSPRKYQRYDKLVEFVKMIAQESNTIKPASPILAWINQASTNLLKEIGEND